MKIFLIMRIYQTPVSLFSQYFIRNENKPVEVTPITSQGRRLIRNCLDKHFHFINLVNLDKDERVLHVLACPREQEEWDKMVALFATKNGLIRKTPLNAFSNVHSGGIRGINLQDGDELVNVALTGEEEGDVRSK